MGYSPLHNRGKRIFLQLKVWEHNIFKRLGLGFLKQARSRTPNRDTEKPPEAIAALDPEE